MEEAIDLGPDGHVTLLEAIGTFVNSAGGRANQQSAHQELFRFVSWCGSDRDLSTISPSDVGNYVERVGGAGMSAKAAERLQVVRRFLSYARKKGLIEVNLAQHVRVPRAKVRTVKEREARPRDMVELTSDGHTQLTQELERLKSERAPLAEAIRSAAADKDVRENAPLEAAREELGHVEFRIRGIEETLSSSVVIASAGRKVGRAVGLGSQVVIQEVDSGRKTSYTVVSALEADPLERKISDASPVGGALVGRVVGDEVAVRTPRGTLRYRIVNVS